MIEIEVKTGDTWELVPIYYHIDIETAQDICLMLRNDFPRHEYRPMVNGMSLILDLSKIFRNHLIDELMRLTELNVSTWRWQGGCFMDRDEYKKLSQLAELVHSMEYPIAMSTNAEIR